MKRILLTVFLLSLFALSPVYALDFAGITLSSETANNVIVYFFDLGIAIGGILAVVVLVRAGIDYVTSQGDVGKIEESKKRIQNAFFGIIVLSASFILLNTINSSLTTVSISKLPEPTTTETSEIPSDLGVYLYNTKGESKFLDKSNPAIEESFKTKSIKMSNANEYNYGAVLFYKEDYEGGCSWIINDLDDINASSGQQNNPAINKVGSVIVFKQKDSSPSVTFYNNIDCKEQTKEYGDKYPGRKSSCTVSSTLTNQKIVEACSDFVGKVLSVRIDGDAGVILKDGANRCQFFERPAYYSCVNTIKSSYIYSPDFLQEQGPESFTIIPMHIEAIMKGNPIIQ